MEKWNIIDIFSWSYLWIYSLLLTFTNKNGHQKDCKDKVFSLFGMKWQAFHQEQLSSVSSDLQQ